MSELNDMSCREFSDVAAELALGVLTGRERAAALAHLDQCDACRENVRQLTMTGEGLLDLLPAAEPPAGFESRVLERIGVATPAPAPVPAAARRAGWFGRLFHLGRPPGSQAGAAPGEARPSRPSRQIGWSRRMLATAAVAVAVIAGGLGGWGLGIGTSSPASTPLSSATLLSTSHQAVGQVYLYQGSSRWLYMAVDLPSGNGRVICQVRGADGQLTTVGSFRLAGGHGYWGSPASAAQGRVTGARLVTANGRVLATASFHSA